VKFIRLRRDGNRRIYFDRRNQGRRNLGVWGVSPTFGTSRVLGGTRGGPMKMIFDSRADSLYSVLYKLLNFNSLDSTTPAKLMISFQISLKLISEKTAWVVFPRSTPLDCCTIQIYMPNRTGRYTI